MINIGIFFNLNIIEFKTVGTSVPSNMITKVEISFEIPLVLGIDMYKDQEIHKFGLFTSITKIVA